MADVGWIVTPTATRDTVRSEGWLPWAGGGETTVDVWSDRDRALARAAEADYVQTPDGRADVWRVDLRGLDVTEVEPWGTFGDLAAPGIAPERLLALEHTA